MTSPAPAPSPSAARAPAPAPGRVSAPSAAESAAESAATSAASSAAPSAAADGAVILEPRLADLGHGLKVRRILPHRTLRSVGPYVFLDHAGPVVVDRAQARLTDVRPHPHIGLATVSYLLSGAITHRDSLGVVQPIVPGDVNWMTAGQGITHSERFEDEAAFTEPGVELLQSWVALPVEDAEVEPAFEHVPVARLPEQTGDGTWLRVIAGRAWGLESPVKVRSPLFQAHLKLDAGARLPYRADYAERGLYVIRGEARVGGVTVPMGRAIVVPAGADVEIEALEPTEAMAFGGEPLGPRLLWWNFVATSPERLDQAKADWKAGRFPLPPADHDTFIPLPEDRPLAAD